MGGGPPRRDELRDVGAERPAVARGRGWRRGERAPRLPPPRGARAGHPGPNHERELPRRMVRARPRGVRLREERDARPEEPARPPRPARPRSHEVAPLRVRREHRERHAALPARSLARGPQEVRAVARRAQANTQGQTPERATTTKSRSTPEPRLLRNPPSAPRASRTSPTLPRPPGTCATAGARRSRSKSCTAAAFS